MTLTGPISAIVGITIIAAVDSAAHFPDFSAKDVTLTSLAIVAVVYLHREMGKLQAARVAEKKEVTDFVDRTLAKHDTFVNKQVEAMSALNKTMAEVERTSREQAEVSRTTIHRLVDIAINERAKRADSETRPPR